ncbi:hypothetical protein ACHHYP_11072 [Achlya hypogyna]|uniref:Secreted protein n=1 Tax=Achlya hypogyna TaxID=1202772 RepID=A0A0A7CP72_ACHHY|nr:secreted protein [Achlya hypogyna]OQR86029.1 hypothetical protein ACHHYP_11072 [Achlya hypogyna]
MSPMRTSIVLALLVCLVTAATNSTNATTPAVTSIVNSECQTAFQQYFTPVSACTDAMANTATFCADTKCVTALSTFVSKFPVECQAIGTSSSVAAQVTPTTFANIQNLLQKCQTGQTGAAAGANVAVATVLIAALAQLL